MAIEDATIFKYRTEKKLSQQALADLLDITRTTMSFYENKRMYPSLETAERMAKVLGKTIGQLYSEEELGIIR